MSSPALAPAGSSTYSSGSMFVGDGTWDSQRNTFLLPNLQGLNLATSQYNGMGNRFANMPGYSNIIRAHGIIAALVFLVIVPSAIMINRFHTRNSMMALRLHIWLQILTLLLATVVFILGYIAVGPARSQTNPHHGIGLTIYILILVQFLGGWWVHSRERRKRLTYMPVKAALHHWLGRLIALLGLAQVPLGLTLYGSPAYLFVLYALVTAVLIVTYFVLSYRKEKYRSRDYSSDYSYASGSGSIQRRESSRFGTMAKAGAAAVGLGYVANRLLKRREESDDDRNSRRPDSISGEEKFSRYSGDSEQGGGFKRWILGFGAIAGVSYWIGGLLGRRNRDSNHERESEYDDDEEEDTTNGTGSSLARAERVEEGRAASGALPAAPLHAGPHPLSQVQNAPSHRGQTQSVLSEESDPSDRGRSGNGVRNALLGLASLGIGGAYWKNRRDRKERERIEALRQREIRDERIVRRDSQRQRYTGDGFPRHGGRRGSLTTDTSDLSREQARRAGMPLSNPSAMAPILGAPGVGGANFGPALPVGSLPGPPPVPMGGLASQSYLQPPFPSGSNTRGSNPGIATAAGLAAGTAAGLATGEAMNSRRRRSRSRANRSAGDGSMGSPPVSVNVKWHPDSRRVTVRRLPEEEIANERARRHRPATSVSSLSASDPIAAGGEGWRRTEARERAEALEIQQQEERARLQAAQQQLNRGQLGVPGTAPLPPPPPVPGSEAGRMRMGSTGSPGTWDATPTETSADYAGNRKRRRAERAAAERARGEGRAGRVDFS